MGRRTVLGIDLGTTNSVVAVADRGVARVLGDDGKRQLIPSVVSFGPNGEVVVGHEAKQRRLTDAENTVYAVKRLIGRPFDSPEVAEARKRFPFSLVPGKSGGVRVSARGDSWSLAEISAYVLRECRRVAEEALHGKCDRAVVTVPANFNELQRSATKAAGMVSGLNVLRIVNEPTAAALAYGLGAERVERVAVYDLGGGTFDFTVLELENDIFEVVATAGDTYLGGDDIDVAIAERMADTVKAQTRWDPRDDAQAFERLRYRAEWAKCRLSEDDQVEVSLGELRDGDATKLRFELSRRELEGLTAPLLARSIGVCRGALDDNGIGPRDIDQVVLVGGSTRMPLVRKEVTDFFSRKPRVDYDPDLVVALGAAVQAHALAARRPRQTISIIRQPGTELDPSLVSPMPGKERSVPPLPIALDQGAADRMVPSGTDVGVGSHTNPDMRSGPPPATGNTDAGMGAIGVQEEALILDFESDDAALPPGAPPASRDAMAALLSAPDEDLPQSLGFQGSPSTGPQPWSPPQVDFDLPEPLAEIDLGQRQAPLLMDVTPLSLGLEVAGGYCEHVIRRNAPIPVEQAKSFSTARDFQDTVRVSICQGESRQFGDNQLLGVVELAGLPQARRGEVQIVVTFMIDADGTLDVRAVDAKTGQERRTRVNLVGGYAPDELEALRTRQEGSLSLDV